jgi:glutathione S-transferase
MAPSEEIKAEKRAALSQELGYFVKFVTKGGNFVGSQFSVADVYAYVCLSWAPYIGLTLDGPVQDYFRGIQQTAGVGSTHESLIATEEAPASVPTTGRRPKLYYTTTSCGVASYIAMTIGEMPFDSEKVDIFGGGTTESGADFEAINWKGNVPTIVLPDGTVLSENVAVLTWINDNAEEKWGPEPGSASWYEMINNLGYINSTIHKYFGQAFMAPSEEIKAEKRAALSQELGYFVKFVTKGGNFVGSQFSVADVYAYVCLSWAPYIGLTLDGPVQDYFRGIQQIAGVGSTHQALNA